MGSARVFTGPIVQKGPVYVNQCSEIAILKVELYFCVF
jgi:hypothetical protein